MNNTITSVYTRNESNLTNSTTSAISTNNNYLSENNTQVKNYNEISLSNRSLSIQQDHQLQLIDLPDNVLDLIFSNLDAGDLRNASEVCKNFLANSRYYLNNFCEAHKLFLEYSLVSQRKITYLFNKSNYNNHLKSWLANFPDINNTLYYLDNIQNINTFYKSLFFYIDKIIRQSTNLRAIEKFTVTADNIIVSVGYSCCNTRLFVADLTGLIKIYHLDKNKNFKIHAEKNLCSYTESAKFSQDGYTIVASDMEKKITIIYLNKENKWEIENNADLTNIQAQIIAFAPNSKYIMTIYETSARFFIRTSKLNRWEYACSYNTDNLKTAIFSPNSKYCVLIEYSGYINILSPQSKTPWHFDILRHDYHIIDTKFSVDSQYFASTRVDNSTNIYKVTSEKSWEKIYSTETKNRFTINTKANAYFSNDCNTVVLNYGKNIQIVNNLHSVEDITILNCNLTSDLGKVCISNNNNYIAVYTFKDSIVKLYTKNDQNQWINIVDIDTEVSIHLVTFNTNEHHFVVISSEKTKVYNLCNCKINNNHQRDNFLTYSSKINTLINKQLQSFTIETPKNTKRYIMFNPYFCQLLVAYNNIIKIFIPSETHNWINKLTLKTDIPIIEKVQYTNNGSHILVRSHDILAKIRLLAIN